MAVIERMPKSGYTMREGFVSKILVQIGESVQKGTPLLEYETDKLTCTVEASGAGTVLQILAREEESYPVLSPLVVIGEPGEEIPAEPAGDAQPKPVDEKAVPETEKPKKAERAFATPRARKIAKDQGIDLMAVTGTGPKGRIQAKDVLSFAEARPKATHLAQKLAAQGEITLDQMTGTGPRGRIGKEDVQHAQTTVEMAARTERLSSMRGTIATRLTQSKQNIPHAYYTYDIDMGALAEIKCKLSKEGLKLTYNDLLLFGVSRVLQSNPLFTARIEEGQIIYPDGVNLGMAVSVNGGLVVPVICCTEKLSLTALAERAAELAKQAKEGKLPADKMSGGSFTVSNLGKYGVRQFSAIINPPESGILAVGAVEDCVCAVDGEMKIKKMATVTLSADHRLIDGAEAAVFLQQLDRFCREPWRMIL